MPRVTAEEAKAIRRKYADLRAAALASRLSQRKAIMAEKKEALKTFDATYDERIAKVEAEYYGDMEDYRTALLVELEGRSPHI